MNVNARARHAGAVTPTKRHRPVTSAGTCPDCGKAIFLTRKDAKTFARTHMPADTPSPYRCAGRTDYWHLGHLPESVKHGDRDRSVLTGIAAPRGDARPTVPVPEREPKTFDTHAPTRIPSPIELATRVQPRGR